MILRVDNSGRVLTDTFCNAVCDDGSVIHHHNSGSNLSSGPDYGNTSYMIDGSVTATSHSAEDTDAPFGVL